LGNKRSGKVKLAKSLGLIEDYQEKYINKLTEIRNKLVHRVKNVNFNFPDYIAGLDTNQMRNFKDAFSFGIGSAKVRRAVFKTDMTKKAFLIKETKLTIWTGGLVCLSEIGYCIEAFKCKRNGIEEQRRLLKTHGEYTKLVDQIISFLEISLKQKGSS
jgi:hypothetical protein